jgi:hypothetical protein
MRDQLDAPSSSVKGTLHRYAQKQLSKWRRQLSSKQIQDILQIVDDVGLSTFYTDDLEPDYDTSNQYQRPQHAW